MLRNQLQGLRLAAAGGLALICGCSLLDRDGGSLPGIPPMFGAADAANEAPDAAPKRRMKLRFANEIANTHKEHRSPRGRKFLAPETQNGMSANRASQIAAAGRPAPMSPVAATDPFVVAAQQASPGFPNHPAPPYPQTSPQAAGYASAPAISITQRLPDTRQVSYGAYPTF